MKYSPIDPQLFVENRKKFCARLPPDSLAVFMSNDQMPRSADGQYMFRQDSDIFYLTGIDQEDSVLLLYPDCPREEYRELLFLRKTNEDIAVWEGHKYTIEEAQKVSGIKGVKWYEEFNTILNSVMCYAQSVYLNLNEHDRTVNEVPYKNLRFALDLKNRFPLHQYSRSARIMGELRSLKTETELALIRNAIAITKKAFDRILKFVKPGVMEYEIEAEITHEFIRNRATGHAYSPIIASGKNACVLHYIDNNAECRDGDMLLLDFGAEYANYAADLTRTLPVNGKFTPRQKEIYDTVLRVMKHARKLLRPGLNLHEFNTKTVGKLMEEELIRLGILKADEVAKQDEDKPLYKKYFMHGTSHYLGLDVHDTGWRFAVLKPGMVFTCEPGLYIPEENIGIRIENNILVTDGDPVDLMSSFPIETEEIENAMRS